jgi:GT2 family glycosyltransferase
VSRILAYFRTYFTVAFSGPKAFTIPNRADAWLLWLVWIIGPLLTLGLIVYTIVSFSIWALLLTLVVAFIALCGIAACEIVRRLATRRHLGRLPDMARMGVHVAKSLIRGRNPLTGLMSLDRYAFTPADRTSFAMGRKPGDVPAIVEHPQVAEPRITIVVPLYNDAWFIGAALASLQAQTLKEWECIVVDDGSTDDGIDVALAFANKDKRFRLLRHDRNRGLAASRNTGVAAARSPYVTFLDSDDYIYSDGLRVRLAATNDDPEQAGVYCGWESVTENVRVAWTGTRPAPSRDRVTMLSAGWEVPFIATAPIVRTDLMRASGGFNEELRTAEDFDFWSRLLRGGVYFDYVPYMGLAYRQRKGSMIRRSPLGHLATVQGVWSNLSQQWDHPWPGAPAPITVPLPEALKASETLPRVMNFLALSLWLNPDEPVGAELQPPAWLWAQRQTREIAATEAGRALTRLGENNAENVATLTARVLALAPERVPAGELLADAKVQQARRDRVRELGAVRGAPLSELDALGPFFGLVPQSRYHVSEVGPLGEELSARGATVAYLIPPEATRGVVDELAWYTDVVYAGDLAETKGKPVVGCFILNDWAPSTNHLMDAVRAAGGTSFAKVEGVQDFADVDTGRERKPYQWADIILGQGPNAVASLPMKDVRIVGSSRLERMAGEPEADANNDTVLINYNFTYGVLADAQDKWIRTCVEGARTDDLPYAISLHPAQEYVPSTPEIKDHVARDPFSHLLLRSGTLITRFSTVVFEAMARGVPVVYYNPHGEQVPTFNNPQGSFVLVTDYDSLPEAIREAESWRGGYRARSKHFFDAQISIDENRRSEQRSADVILDVVGSRFTP